MITAKAIGNPIDFIAERHEALKAVTGTDGFLLASGSDIDVLVQRQQDDSYGCTIEPVSPALGPLYTHAKALGIWIEGQLYRADWFPSPTAVNALQRRLGREPGVDCFEFVHSPHDLIPNTSYHIRRGQFPQSTGVKYFLHDRDETHAVGAILAMPEAVSSIRRSQYPGVDFDLFSDAYKFMLEQITSGKYDPASPTVDHGTSLVPKMLGIKRHTNEKKRREDAIAAYNKILEHYEAQIKPAVEAACLDLRPNPIAEEVSTVFRSLDSLRQK